MTWYGGDHPSQHHNRRRHGRIVTPESKALVRVNKLRRRSLTVNLCVCGAVLRRSEVGAGMCGACALEVAA
jgi:hypothetical protein